MHFNGRWKGPLFSNIPICTIGMPTSSILISIIRRSTLLLSQLVASQPTWASCASLSPKHPRYRICRWNIGAIFCKRSNAMINWHKSCAIWLSHETHPAWHPHPAFKWIKQGESTKYLGFQIGFNIPTETIIAPIILSIRQKLIHWSSKKLSLAGRIIVANQVLLATTWYSLSCWTISKESIHQIQRLVRNYIWSGKEDQVTRAKVAWPILTTPKSRGGSCQE